MDNVRLRMFLCPEHRYPPWNCECWLLSSPLWPFLLISSVPEPWTSTAKPLPDVQGLRCEFIISPLTHILSHPREGQLHSSSWLSQSSELHMLSSRKSSYLSSIFTVQPLSCPTWQLSHRTITTCLDPVQGPLTSTTQTPAISSPCTTLGGGWSLLLECQTRPPLLTLFRVSTYAVLSKMAITGPCAAEKLKCGGVTDELTQLI